MEERKDLFNGVDEEISEARETKTSDTEDNNQVYDMNVKPMLGKFATWRLKRKLKSIAKKEEKKLTKQKEKEELEQGMVTRKEVREPAIMSTVFVAELVVAIAFTSVFLSTAPFIAGMAATVALFTVPALLVSAKETIQKYKEYKKTHPTVKKQKKDKNKKGKKKSKKLSLFKKFKNIISKSKNKNDNDSQVDQELEMIDLTPVEIDSHQNDEQPVESNNELETVKYSLDENGKKIATVDLSNISMNPGLDVNIQHFIIKKDDSIMQELIEQYIEKTTGSPAVYTDQVIDNKEKRVYMLNR